MKRALFNFIIIIYVIIAISVTFCLLTYNDYKISEIGSKSLIIIEKEEEGFEYKKGDLVILDKENYENAKEGETVFFYENGGVKMAEIKEINKYDSANAIITVDGDYQVLYEDIIGTSQQQKVIHKVGGILKIIESKWGFLFLIVFPSLLAFLHEVFELIMELSNKK